MNYSFIADTVSTTLFEEEPKPYETGKSSPGKKSKIIKVPEDSPVTPDIIRELEKFMEAVPAGRLSRNLRNLLLIALASEQDYFTTDFEDLIIDLYFLFAFLDLLEDEAAAA